MSFIKQHIYIFLFLLTITEWPITSFVSSWFAAQWLLRIEYVFIIALFWDIVWDIILYLIGRFLYKISRIKKQHNKITQKNKFKYIYDKYPFIYFLIVKITPYLSSTSLISVWIKKKNFFSFLKYSILISIIVKTIYITMGYIWSITIGQLNKFLDWWKIIIIYIIAWLSLLRLIKKLYERIGYKLKNKIKNINI